MTPSQAIILKFGGVRPTARMFGLAVSTVQYWWETGIPGKRQQEILDVGAENGIEIDHKEFFEIPNQDKKQKRTNTSAAAHVNPN